MCGSSLELRPGLSIDLSTFPPCKRVLVQHIKRVNFQVCIWKRAHENNPAIPSPLDNGFHLNSENGKLEPLWFEGDVIPKALIDVLVEEGTDEDDLEASLLQTRPKFWHRLLKTCIVVYLQEVYFSFVPSYYLFYFS